MIQHIYHVVLHGWVTTEEEEEEEEEEDEEEEEVKDPVESLTLPVLYMKL